MNLTETAYAMNADELFHEAGRQFAMAEAVDPFATRLYERGGWFLLLVHAERTNGVQPSVPAPAGVGDKHG